MKLLLNKNGFVMVLVVAIVLGMMVLTVGLMQRSSSQAISSEDMVRDIQARQYAQGQWWRIHNDMEAGGICPDGETNSDTLNGTTFTYVVTCTGANPVQLNVDVSW